MAHFNDLKARYSIAFDKLSQIEDLSEISGEVSSLDTTIASIEGFVNSRLNDTPAEEPAPEAPAEEPAAEEPPVEEGF